MSRGKQSFSEDGWGGSGKRKLEEADLDITPMIDVTFLLLIFFMVSSTMQATPDLEVPAAKYGKGLETKNAIVFFVSASGSKEQPPVITQGKSQDEITLEQVTSLVEQASQAGKKHVIIRADGAAPSGFIDDLERAINKVEGISIAVGVRDKNKGS
ncbi:MAG: biopolymer transporter ExbD [Planctomycetaceae bacterium]